MIGFTTFIVLLFVFIGGVILGDYLDSKFSYNSWSGFVINFISIIGIIINFISIIGIIITVLLGIVSLAISFSEASAKLDKECQAKATYKKGNEVQLKSSERILLVKQVSCSGEQITYKLLTPDANEVSIEQELLKNAE